MFYSGSEEVLLIPQLLRCLPVLHSHEWMRALLCFVCRPGMSRVKHEGLGHVSVPGSEHSGRCLSTSLAPLRGCFLSLMGIAFILLWHSAPHSVLQQYQNGESEESHEQFLKALQNAVSTFVNRMKSNHMRGRSITNDSAVLSLFQSINSMHPQLLELLNQLDERRRRCPSARPPRIP